MASGGDVEAQKSMEPSPRLQNATIARTKSLGGGVDKVKTNETSKMSTLAGWKTLFFLEGTIWANRILWTMVLKVMLLSLTIMLLVVFTPFDANGIDTSRFAMISNFLKVFVGFLLGFYMTSSVKRWSDSVEGFLQLGDAVRNMMAQLTALGVPQEHLKDLTRYGVLSAEFLITELESRSLPDDEEIKAFREEVYQYCLEPHPETDKNGHVIQVPAQLTQPEVETLRKVEEGSALMWVWIGSRIGRLSNDGLIPGMATPTYARLMTIAERASQGIRTVHVNSKVQMPFIYVHCLAVLVHLNNVLCAISFGLVTGTELAQLLMRAGFHVHPSNVMPADDKGSISSDVQAILTAFIINVFSPVMYQAFLQIGLVLSQPFDNTFGEKMGQLPTVEIVEDLKKDLKNAEFMAKNIHGWEAPMWKAPK